MSARACREEGCGKLIVFAKDKDTGATIPLTNQVKVYRIIGTKDGTTYVQHDPKALVSHFVNCANPNRFSKSKPAAEQLPLQRDFNEPKEIGDPD